MRNTWETKPLPAFELRFFSFLPVDSSGTFLASLSSVSVLISGDIKADFANWLWRQTDRCGPLCIRHCIGSRGSVGSQLLLCQITGCSWHICDTYNSSSWYQVERISEYNHLILCFYFLLILKYHLMGTSLDPRPITVINEIPTQSLVGRGYKSWNEWMKLRMEPKSYVKCLRLAEWKMGCLNTPWSYHWAKNGAFAGLLIGVSGTSLPRLQGLVEPVVIISDKSFYVWKKARFCSLWLCSAVVLPGPSYS